MANINPKSIYAKTPKGVLDVKNKTAKLTREEGTVFLMVDGKSTVADLLKRSGMADLRLNYAIDKLTNDGYIKLFSAPVAAQGQHSPAQERSREMLLCDGDLTEQAVI